MDVEAEAMAMEVAVLVAEAAEIVGADAEIVGANAEEVLAVISWPRWAENREAAAAEATSDTLGVSGLV